LTDILILPLNGPITPLKNSTFSGIKSSIGSTPIILFLPINEFDQFQDKQPKSTIQPLFSNELKSITDHNSPSIVSDNVIIINVVFC
jgi:hypothetical protein